MDKITITKEKFRDVACDVLSDITMKLEENNSDPMMLALDTLKNTMLVSLIEKKLFDNEEK